MSLFFDVTEHPNDKSVVVNLEAYDKFYLEEEDTKDGLIFKLQLVRNDVICNTYYISKEQAVNLWGYVTKVKN